MYFVATLPSAPPLRPLLLQDLGLELGLELPEDVLRGLHVPRQRVHLGANNSFKKEFKFEPQCLSMFLWSKTCRSRYSKTEGHHYQAL
jgi:hypothetical protein